MASVNNFFNNIKAMKGDDETFVTRIADAAGVSRASVNNWVRGIGDPSLSSIEKVAAALRIPIVKLLGDQVPVLPGPSREELRLLAIRAIINASDLDSVLEALDPFFDSPPKERKRGSSTA